MKQFTTRQFAAGLIGVSENSVSKFEIVKIHKQLRAMQKQGLVDKIVRSHKAYWSVK